MEIARLLSTLASRLLSCFGMPARSASLTMLSAEAPQDIDELLNLIAVESQAQTTADLESAEAYQKRIRHNLGRPFLVTVELAAASTEPRKTTAFSYNSATQILKVTLVGDSTVELSKFVALQRRDSGLPPQAPPTVRCTKFTLATTGPDLEKEYSRAKLTGGATAVHVHRSKFSAVAFLNIPQNSTPSLATVNVKMSPQAARDLSKRAGWRLLLQTAMAPGQRSLVFRDGSFLEPGAESADEACTDGHTITANILIAELIDSESNAVIASFRLKHAQSTPTLTSWKDRPVLGVLLAPITPAIATARGLAGPHGAMVTSVAPDSAADKAGVKKGDVLLEVAGKVIKKPLDVSASLDRVPPGSAVPISLVHHGAQARLTVNF